MSLWLVRHAQPVVEPGVCYGASNMPALEAATQDAASALAAQLPPNADVLASPLQRCQQLATALCAMRPDLATSTDTRLQEMNFGAWEGVAWSAIPRSAMDAWMDDFAHHRFGGVESAQQLMDRVAGVWSDSWRRWQETGRVQCWVTHAGVIRAACLLHQGTRLLQSASQWPQDAAPFGGARVLEAPGA